MKTEEEIRRKHTKYNEHNNNNNDDDDLRRQVSEWASERLKEK